MTKYIVAGTYQRLHNPWCFLQPLGGAPTWLQHHRPEWIEDSSWPDDEIHWPMAPLVLLDLYQWEEDLNAVETGDVSEPDLGQEDVADCTGLQITAYPFWCASDPCRDSGSCEVFPAFAVYPATARDAGTGFPAQD